MLGRAQQPDASLSRDLLAEMRGKTNELLAHVALITNWYGQYLALRNTSATYWLAVIVGVVTIAGVVGVGDGWQW